MLYVFSEDISESRLVLSKEESHHLVAVRRGRVGEKVKVLNGKGSIASAVVAVADPKHAQLEIQELHQEPPREAPIALVQALPKGKTMDLIVQKATEMGVATIIPVFTRFSESRIDSERGEKKVGKWNQVALESLKQCGNPYLPQIIAPVELGSLPVRDLPELRLVASLESGSKTITATLSGASGAAGCVIAIGPEGDFSPEEYAYLRENNFRAVNLGKHVLRAETAAIAAIAIAGEVFRSLR